MTTWQLVQALYRGNPWSFWIILGGGLLMLGVIVILWLWIEITTESRYGNCDMCGKEQADTGVCVSCADYIRTNIRK